MMGHWTDEAKRDKCKAELRRDRDAAANGAMIEPARSEWDVAAFLWGEACADRLYPNHRAKQTKEVP